VDDGRPRGSASSAHGQSRASKAGSAVAACGATPPQAPLSQAKRLDSATSGISTACGESYQITAFAGDHRRDLDTLETTAASDARKLSSVYRRNPAWIYQGETVTKIVLDARSSLRGCGLPRAQTVLAELTRNR
jgi:hypothetical protein